MNSNNNEVILRKKRRRINSKLKHASDEILVAAKIADINSKVGSLKECYGDKMNRSVSLGACGSSFVRPNPNTLVSFSESDSSTDNYSSVHYNPTVSDSSDEAASLNISYAIHDLISSSENDSSSLSSDSETESNIQDFLREWFLSYKGLPINALTSLLKGLQKWFPSLPAEGRTLLHTPRNVEIANMGNGLYHNFGISESLNKKLSTISLESLTELHLNINIDGLPVHNSTKNQFWPILASLQEDPEKRPFLVAVFYGKTKPPVHEFLTPFVSEFNKLEKDGIKFMGKIYSIKIRCFICDAPAKAFVKCIKSHTGYYGCDKCSQVGVRVNRVQTFPETDAGPRTNSSFRKQENPEHHKDQTPLLDLNIDLISTFPARLYAFSLSWSYASSITFLGWKSKI